MKTCLSPSFQFIQFLFLFIKIIFLFVCLFNDSILPSATCCNGSKTKNRKPIPSHQSPTMHHPIHFFTNIRINKLVANLSTKQMQNNPRRLLEHEHILLEATKSHSICFHTYTPTHTTELTNATAFCCVWFICL